MKQMTTEQAKNKIEEIKAKLRRGADYDECLAEAVEPLAIINKKGAEIAKKHGFRYKPLTFSYLAR